MSPHAVAMFARHLVPNGGAGTIREIGKGAVGRFFRPVAEIAELLHLFVIPEEAHGAAERIFHPPAA